MTTDSVMGIRRTNLALNRVNDGTSRCLLAENPWNRHWAV